MNYSDRDGSEHPADAWGLHGGPHKTFGVPAGPPLHEATDRAGDNVPSGEERVREHRYGKVIWETSRADEGTISATGANAVARAVMAVTDVELAELRDRIDFIESEWEHDRDGRAEWFEKCQDAEYRLRQAGATIARVEALADSLDILDGPVVERLRAALRGPEPAEEP